MLWGPWQLHEYTETPTGTQRPPGDSVFFYGDPDILTESSVLQGPQNTHRDLKTPPWGP